MGIKKRLEQISNQPEQPDRLTDIVVEEPVEKKGLDFDVETEVSQEVWESMVANYKQNCEEDVWETALKMAYDLKIIFPERVGELGLEDKWEDMQEVCGLYFDEGSWDDGAEMAIYLRELFPERFDELQIDNHEVEILEDHCDYCDRGAWFVATISAANFKILFPDKVKSLKLEYKWKNMLGEYYRMDQDQIARQAVNLKILFPDKASELGLEDKWKELKGEYLKACQNERWWEVARLAAELKILAAKEIRITDQGVELVVGSNEEFEDKTPPRPERLNCE